MTSFRADDLDWADVRDRMRRRLAPKFTSRGKEFVEDTVSEAVLRLLRVAQRAPIENLNGLISHVCDWTERTAIARIRRQAARIGRLPEGVEPIAPDPALRDESEDPLFRIRWLVLSHFEATNAPCCELAREVFAGKTHQQIAEESGRSHDSVRQHWSRCQRAFRRDFADEPGPLWDWIHEFE